MSHSSKLMTIGSMIQDLERLRDFLSSQVEISIPDYLALNDIFDDVAKLKATIDSLQLVVMLEHSEQGLILRGSRLEGDQVSKSGKVVSHPDSTTYWLTVDQMSFDEMLNLIENTRKTAGTLT